MNAETAHRINTAVSRAWLFRNGLLERLSFEEIATINSVSEAQIQTAIDVVNADDDHRPANASGWRIVHCSIEPSAAKALKAYVAQLPTQPS